MKGSITEAVRDAGFSIERYTDRERWLQGRSTCVGGSDVSALFKDDDGTSVNPFKSEYKLWCEKSGLIDVSAEENEAMEWGRRAEPMIAAWYEESAGRKLIYDGPFTILRSKEHSERGVSVDRRIEAFDHRGPGILSIKNVGLWRQDDWDAGRMDATRMRAAIDEMADEWEPPEHYQMQLQYELGITGYQWGAFAVLIGGQRAIQWEVERHDAFIDELFKRVSRFWKRVVDRDAPAVDGDKHTTNALKAMYRRYDEGKLVQLSPQVQQWTNELTQVDAQIKALNTQREELRNLVKHEMKDAMVGQLPDGGKWRWKNVKKGSQGPTEYRELRRVK